MEPASIQNPKSKQISYNDSDSKKIYKDITQLKTAISKDINTRQGVTTVQARFWDAQFEKWKYKAAPLDDPKIPVPGAHPFKEHPWN